MGIFRLALAVLACAFAQFASAQSDWPSKPVRIIANFPPGGGVDILARMLAPKLQEALGQPFVVENRPGANGALGGELVAKAAADGYTLLMTSGGMLTTNPHLYKMSFDPLKVFDPVTQVARVPILFVARPNFPASNGRELLAHIRQNQTKVTYGSAGNGSSPHIAGELLRQAGFVLSHVPYKGLAPAVTDLLGGQLDMVLDAGVAVPHVRSGKLKLIAVGSPQRLPVFPNAPTIAESGIPGYDGDSAHALVVPAGTPAAIVARLNAEVVRILRLPESVERVRGLAAEPIGNTPAQFASSWSADHARIGALVREASITAQ
jgi:tripartite-type tricarboxylate transporter receptor subunit TctC